MVDKYTKIILTIIAANLTLMTLQSFDLVPKAEALGAPPTRVALCDYGGDCLSFYKDSINVRVND